MGKIYLIRHGMTDHNVQSRYCGHSDPSLNNEGRKQAKELSKRMKSEKIDIVYSSDLKRAYETAQIVFDDREILKNQHLKEMNFGVFEGLNYKEITDKYPHIYENWVKNVNKGKIPEGENIKNFHRRIKNGIDNVINENKGKNIAIVTHAGVINFYISGIIGINIKEALYIKQDHCALNILEDLKDGIKVLRINDNSHLRI